MNINYRVSKSSKYGILCNKDGCIKLHRDGDMYVALTVYRGSSLDPANYCESCLKEELENILLELKLKAFK